MKVRNPNIREVYVWQLPVRIFHWLNAFCITVLCITGYIIGNPPAILIATEAIHNYWFGWVRLIHLSMAMIFIINFLVRVYWAWAGNTFARWYNFIPLKRSQWRSIFRTLKIDIFLLSKDPIYDIGHNSLAALTYLGLFVIIIAQIATGAMMMFVTTDNIARPVTDWALFELNGFFVVRFIHHVLMWLFIIFGIIHIYLVFYHDYIERNGIASSMIGGWKFIRSDVVDEAEIEQDAEKIVSDEKKAIRHEE